MQEMCLRDAYTSDKNNKTDYSRLSSEYTKF